MQRHFFSLRIAAWVIAAGLIYSAVDLWWHGFVVVHDPARVVAAVAIEGDTRHILRQFSPGYWAARPTEAGVIRITCSNGARIKRADVEPGRQTSYTVTRDDCAGPR